MDKHSPSDTPDQLAATSRTAQRISIRSPAASSRGTRCRSCAHCCSRDRRETSAIPWSRFGRHSARPAIYGPQPVTSIVRSKITNGLRCRRTSASSIFFSSREERGRHAYSARGSLGRWGENHLRVLLAEGASVWVADIDSSRRMRARQLGLPAECVVGDDGPRCRPTLLR